MILNSPFVTGSLIAANDALVSGSLTVLGGITGSLSSNQDIIVNNVNIGEGGGSVVSNTRVGAGALSANTTGANNTAIGQCSLEDTLP